MAEEKVVVKKGDKAQSFKKLLTLEPIFINKFAPKLKPFIKPVYYVLAIILALTLLMAFVDLFRVGIYAFVIEAVLACLYFIVVRMFAEYIANG
ncbi:MAG: hypothetical protein IKS41_06420 [Alphaproteobacteria bacterium]|nr:hypothetical protein [Alphaproteobacteria bacterium]